MVSITISDGGLYAKDPADAMLCLFDWDAEMLASGVSISSSTFTVTAERPSDATVLTKSSESIVSSSRKTQLVLSGGTLGARYRIDNTIVTNESPSQTIERSFKLLINHR